MTYDLISIGSGAAGLSAALYAGRYNMKTLVIGKEFGGETARAGVIWNYPGAVGIDGFDLMLAMKKQAEDVGAKVIDAEVKSVTRDGECFTVETTKGEKHHALSVLFAMGSERLRLGLPNEHELTSKGVHFCVTCDGPLYGGKKVIMVGGGDAAVKGINLLGHYASKIYVLLRGKAFRAEAINLDEMKKLGDKVEILFETQVKEIVGTTKFEKVILDKPFNGSNELAVDGLFIEIGAKPSVALAQSLGVTLDPLGYLATDTLMKTNIPGVYAAGDITNMFGSFKQDITASAMGAVAATSAHNYVKGRRDTCSHS